MFNLFLFSSSPVELPYFFEEGLCQCLDNRRYDCEPSSVSHYITVHYFNCSVSRTARFPFVNVISHLLDVTLAVRSKCVVIGLQPEYVSLGS